MTVSNSCLRNGPPISALKANRTKLPRWSWISIACDAPLLLPAQTLGETLRPGCREPKHARRSVAVGEDKFVAIDIETGEYELDKDELKAADGCDQPALAILRFAWKVEFTGPQSRAKCVR